MEAARPAVAADVGRLVALYAEAVAELSPLRGGALWAVRESRADPAATLTTAIDDPDQLVVAGTIDGTVVGFAAVRVERLRNGTELGVVDDIYVEPAARSVGVGEAMIEVVLEWCRQRRCAGVDGFALPGARATKNFFETFGFTARGIIVHRTLEPLPREEP